MGSTTTKGFRYPAASDAVNIPGDLGNLAGDVDTYLNNYVLKSGLTTKGDIFVATGASTPTRLAVGTDGFVLTADSTQASGLKWASAASGTITGVTAGTGLSGGGSSGSVTLSLDKRAATTLTQNAQAASYTLVLTDADLKLVELSNASALTLTVPTNASVAFPIGCQINILQTGAGQVTVAGAGGVTVNGTPGLKLRTTWSGGTLIKRATDTWVLIGDLSA